MNEEKDNKDKESPESGQACFPTEIAEVDGFSRAFSSPTAPTFAMNGSGRCP